MSLLLRRRSAVSAGGWWDAYLDEFELVYVEEAGGWIKGANLQVIQDINTVTSTLSWICAHDYNQGNYKQYIRLVDNADTAGKCFHGYWIEPHSIWQASNSDFAHRDNVFDPAKPVSVIGNTYSYDTNPDFTIIPYGSILYDDFGWNLYNWDDMNPNPRLEATGWFDPEFKVFMFTDQQENKALIEEIGLFLDNMYN